MLCLLPSVPRGDAFKVVAPVAGAEAASGEAWHGVPCVLEFSRPLGASLGSHWTFSTRPRASRFSIGCSRSTEEAWSS